MSHFQIQRWRLAALIIFGATKRLLRYANGEVFPMLLVVILNSPNPYENRTEIKVPSINHTKQEKGNLVAFNGSVEEVARFNLEDVRNYHLEED